MITLKTHRFRLEGENLTGTKVNSLLLRNFLDLLVEGSRRAARLRFEGRSTKKGTPPAWLNDAASFDIELKPGSTIVETSEPTFGEALKEHRWQQDLFNLTPQPNETAVELLVAGLADASCGKMDSDLYDNGLIEVFEGLGPVFGMGVRRISIENGGAVGEVLPASVTTIENLREKTPPPQQIRIAGKLDTIKHSDRMFVLVLETGQAIKGLAEEIDENSLANLWGQKAVISGIGVFKPDGKLLRIEADHIKPAGADYEIWSVLPSPVGRQLDTASLSRPQGPRSGVAAILGKIPAEETDKEFIKAVEELS